MRFRRYHQFSAVRTASLDFITDSALFESFAGGVHFLEWRGTTKLNNSCNNLRGNIPAK